MDTAVAKVGSTRQGGVRQRTIAFTELTKPRIAVLLVLTSAAGFYLASPGGMNWIGFTHAMAAISLLAFGVATLNQFWERKIDPLMERTAARPIPSGRVTATEALIFGSLLCVAAELYLLFVVNGLTAALGLVVIVGYVLVYTPLKTRTSASTAIGAIPGALPPLMGWTAAANDITLTAWALFAIQFLWQFPHFFAIAWMYKDEYKNAGILMLPVLDPGGRLTFRQIVLFTVLLLPISVAPFFLGLSGIYFLIGALILGIGFLIASVNSARTKSVKSARHVLLASVIYLPLLFLLMVMDRQ
jgi:heme o synthase